MKKHLLKMDDLSKEEILDILNLADQLKYEFKHAIPHEHLKGKSLGSPPAPGRSALPAP